MSYEYEQRLHRWFLHHLQEPVGSLLIHFLRQIKDYRLIAVTDSSQRQLIYYGFGLSNSYKAVFAFNSNGFLQI